MLKLIGAALVAGLFLCACAAPSSTSTSPETAETADSQSEQDAGARLACGHFRNVMKDVADGVLTDSELRQKLKEVDDDAIIGTPEVQEAARRMLSTVTQNDSEGFLQAVGDMDTACEATGH